eukprot:CAMPEP_0113536948 /NCGR_PEP_ID=MMETSP0015_2-20120614/6554_1 /TAXON_ID=2838 /ORGANISM="Odontella" /LENGTH=165 /DNA_ID=CAMNT_0000436389 /DNA_START=162 /DNA_END=659 /DNA_ORIENTATION=- /assembly_acc=CAM_ASM_000160
MFRHRTGEVECPEIALTASHSPDNEIAIVEWDDSGGPQPHFQGLDGVARAVVGYSGGRKPNPTYRSIEDHTEAVLVEYDPRTISYEDILAEWAGLDYPYSSGKTQYRSAVWYTSEYQREAAERTVEAIRTNARGREVYASVEPATKFYRAEEYHQNFLRKQGRNM